MARIDPPKSVEEVDPKLFMGAAASSSALGGKAKPIPRDQLFSRTIDDATLVELGRDRRMLKLDLLDPSEYNSRLFYSEQRIRAITESLRTGQLIPILVTPNKVSQGRYIVVDGWTRVLSLRSSGETEAWAVIRENMSEEEIARYNFKANDDRNDLWDIERAHYFKRYFDDFGGRRKVSDVLAEVFGEKYRGRTHHFRAFGEFSDKVLQMMRERPDVFNAYVAYELKLLHKALLENTLSREDADALFEITVRRTASASNPVAFIRSRRALASKAPPPAPAVKIPLSALSSAQIKVARQRASFSGWVPERFNSVLEKHLRACSAEIEQLIAEESKEVAFGPNVDDDDEDAA